MNVKLETDAFRIWQFCNGLGWDCDSRQIADALEIPMSRVTRVLVVKGWATRVRTLNLAGNDPRIDLRLANDYHLDGIAFRDVIRSMTKPEASAG
jgi:hypothetical protein